MHTVHRLFGPWQQIGGINTLNMERHMNAQNVLILVSIEGLANVSDTYRTEPTEVTALSFTLGARISISRARVTPTYRSRAASAISFQ